MIVTYILALTQKLLSRVLNIQNSCFRFPYNVCKFNHLFPLFTQSHFISVLLSIFVVSWLIRSSIPFYLCNLLHFNSESQFLRDPFHNSLFFPIHHSAKFRAAFFYIAVKLYNTLSFPIRYSSYNCNSSFSLSDRC